MSVLALLSLVAAAALAADDKSLGERVQKEFVDPALRAVSGAADSLGKADSEPPPSSPPPFLALSPPARRAVDWLQQQWIRPLMGKAESQAHRAARKLADPEDFAEEAPESASAPGVDAEPPAAPEETRQDSMGLIRAPEGSEPPQGSPLPRAEAPTPSGTTQDAPGAGRLSPMRGGTNSRFQPLKPRTP